MKQLHRSDPVNPTVKYWSDSTGRDSYIVTNNGGFFTRSPSMQPRTSFTMNLNREAARAKNHYVEKQIHYYNDGTGKDSYIK